PLPVFLMPCPPQERSILLCKPTANALRRCGKPLQEPTQPLSPSKPDRPVATFCRTGACVVQPPRRFALPFASVRADSCWTAEKRAYWQERRNLCRTNPYTKYSQLLGGHYAPKGHRRSHVEPFCRAVGGALSVRTRRSARAGHPPSARHLGL